MRTPAGRRRQITPPTPRAGGPDDSEAIFQRGLDAAPAAEEIYQGLMRHYLTHGSGPDGVAVYERIRRTSTPATAPGGREGLAS